LPHFLDATLLSFLKVRGVNMERVGVFNNTFCKKCLVKDMPEEAYFKNLYEYIDSIDKDFKVSDEEYERRLELCKLCDNLLNGMCRKCGCFVELRAAMKTKNCPDTNKLW
jgi:hypothetical protein